MTGTEPASAPPLSTRTLQTYAQDWALFTDWCAATDHPALPAHPDAVLRFLADCPATRSTQRCRVTAIDHHHAGTGLPKPGESGVVRAALGRPVGDRPAPPVMPEQVAAALRGLPSHGWTQGMFGRRDRCLLVLSQIGGVPYQHLAALTVGDLTFSGAAIVTTAAGAWMVAPDDDPVLCGSCAVARWLRVLDMVMTKPSHRHLARVVGKAKPVTGRSTHLCRSTRRLLSPETLDTPLLPPIDQWGYVPFPLQPMTPHSLSRLVRDLLAGDLGAHRHLPVDLDQDAESVKPTPVPVVQRAVYTRDDAQRAWARRRADIDDLAGVDAILAEVDARAADLQRRTAAILVGQTDRAEPA